MFKSHARTLYNLNLLKIILLILSCLVIAVLTSKICFAAEKFRRYQIITGNEEKAYLLDTTTGFTWILTYRTMATGREPVAIPFKFIKISPQNQKNFILESTNGATIPTNGMP